MNYYNLWVKLTETPFGWSACGSRLNLPETCGNCGSQNAVAHKLRWKMVSKGSVAFFYY
jgi:hypothetical protein